MIRNLEVKELSNELFKPYGSVIDPEKLEPKMKEDIFTFWDGLAEMKVDGILTVGFLEVYERSKEFSKMERHIRTKEIFFVIDNSVIALVGKPTPDQDFPDPETVRAFLVKPGQGVLLKEGTWHWIPYPLAKKARLLVLFKKGTPDEDLEIKDLLEKGLSFRINI
ncbi:ureidoglycolate lyase [Thermotoga neapolitana]|nr:ureidoglycolate lyase [Thermotoga neapolitana]KFZ22180.1 Ureidoglycolate hydrolase [Thermotoga neapolitana LA10]